MRAQSRKAVAELPEAARVNFLTAAAQLYSTSLPTLSTHLGQQALQVSTAPGLIECLKKRVAVLKYNALMHIAIPVLQHAHAPKLAAAHAAAMLLLAPGLLCKSR